MRGDGGVDRWEKIREREGESWWAKGLYSRVEIPLGTKGQCPKTVVGHPPLVPASNPRPSWTRLRPYEDSRSVQETDPRSSTTGGEARGEQKGAANGG
jgi:hypothetical protein